VTWFKVDDRFHSHPKAMTASLTALGLWSVAGSWSGDHLTDGFIPDHMIPSLTRGQIELAKELCAAGLWKRSRGGYQFHQWHEDADGTPRNPTKEEVTSTRAKRAKAGRMGGLASGRTRSKPQSKSEASASAGASRIVEPPSRPDPTRTKSSLVSVGDSSSVVDVGRPDDDSKIDERITALIHEHTGRKVEPHWAARIRHQLLDDREVSNALAYVSSAIRGEPAKYLPPSQDDTSAAVLDMVRSGDVRPDVAKRRADAIRAALPKARP
jgi:hypothetical protein